MHNSLQTSRMTNVERCAVLGELRVGDMQPVAYRISHVNGEV